MDEFGQGKIAAATSGCWTIRRVISEPGLPAEAEHAVDLLVAVWNRYRPVSSERRRRPPKAANLT
jgi:hypothetical protein